MMMKMHGMKFIDQRRVAGRLIAAVALVCALCVTFRVEAQVTGQQGYQDLRAYRQQRPIQDAFSNPIPRGFGNYGIAQVDAFGNASRRTGGIRPVGMFDNPAQFNAMRSYQHANRQPARRTLPMDYLTNSNLTDTIFEGSPLILSPYGGSYGTEEPSQGSIGGLTVLDTSATDLRAFLNLRSNAAQTTSLTTILDNVPVGGGRSLMPQYGSTPFQEGSADDAPVEGLSLDVQLASRLNAQHSATRDRAWTQFWDRNYTRAIRDFSTVRTLDPDDYRSRVAEVFALLSLEKIRTAQRVVEGLVKDADNPFAIRTRDQDQLFSIGPFYSSRVEVDTVRRRLNSYVLGNPNDAALAGLQVFCLWYLDESGRQEARTKVRRLASMAPRSFADWPSQMQAALESVASEPERP